MTKDGNGTMIRWAFGILGSAITLYATSAVSYARGQASLGNRVTVVEVRQEGLAKQLDKMDKKLDRLLDRE